MVRGREFTAAEEDSNATARVAIVDELLARQLFPDRDPIGQMIRIARRDREAGTGNDGEPMEIVGIAPGLRDTLFDRAPVPHVYVPTGRNYRAMLNVHIRTSSPAAEADVLGAVRRELALVDARLPLLDLMPMRRFHDRSLELWAVRAGGNMVTALGLLALLLAVVGVYGVKSYVVSRRTREIGIRMAVGAQPRDVLWMVVREGATLTALGLAIGLPLAGSVGHGPQSPALRSQPARSDCLPRRPTDSRVVGALCELAAGAPGDESRSRSPRCERNKKPRPRRTQGFTREK